MHILQSSFQNGHLDDLKKRLINIFIREKPPELESYSQILEKINQTLLNEDNTIRPYDSNELPGGLIFLKKNITTIIVPDLHARMDFLLNILFFKDINGISVLDRMAYDKLQIVCVGDGFHAERRAAKRWQLAFEEYKDDYKKHIHMDNEMKESLGVMEMVMEVKLHYPNHFHFLKGNHENITNENGGGNFPFRKFSFEGPMVLYYIEKFYGKDFLNRYYNFEKNLPLLAVGENFLISHAEPLTFYNQSEVINYRNNPELIKGLTWTDNDEAEEESVLKMLEHYLPNIPLQNCYYFGGHRPVMGLYNKRANDKYIQVHNPTKFIIAVIKSGKQINLDDDIVEIKNKYQDIINNNQ